MPILTATRPNDGCFAFLNETMKKATSGGRGVQSDGQTSIHFGEIKISSQSPL